MEEIDLTHAIIGSAIEVHRRLGPGLLESAYRVCLAYELQKRGFEVTEEKPIPVIYDNVKLECGFRADLIVNNEIVVELKAKQAIHPSSRQGSSAIALEIDESSVGIADQLSRGEIDRWRQPHREWLLDSAKKWKHRGTEDTELLRFVFLCDLRASVFQKLQTSELIRSGY